jgi:hypothetical protein
LDTAKLEMAQLHECDAFKDCGHKGKPPPGHGWFGQGHECGVSSETAFGSAATSVSRQEELAWRSQPSWSGRPTC